MINRIRDILHPKCIVCSKDNKQGLKLEFHLEKDGSVKAEFQCEKSLEGYSGILHGGVISTILDGAMCNCIFAQGKAAVTAEMNIRFRHPVKIFKDAVVFARITESLTPLYILTAEIVQEGVVKVMAKAKFYEQPNLIDQVSARIMELGAEI